MSVRHDGNLALKLLKRGMVASVLCACLPVPGDGDLDALDDERPHRRRSEYRDRVGPGRGERGNDPAGLPPLVPGGFGLRLVYGLPIARGAGQSGMLLRV